ncbi:hypothetical protein [Agathobaculum sp.]|nr:hypothetical protein [Agathobaculum sp.]MDY3619211.1 hypothetical protein [Agathobaculum sp.]
MNRDAELAVSVCYPEAPDITPGEIKALIAQIRAGFDRAAP